MKTLIFSLLFAFSSFITLEAQFNESPILNLENEDKKILNWGYYLGFNQYDFKIDYNEHDYTDDYYYDDVLVSKDFGFNVGLIGELRLGNHLDLRLEPGLYYNQRNVGFRDDPFTSAEIVDVKSTYIHIPLLLKASTKRFGNIKPYVVGGASTSYNLSSNEESIDGIKEGKFRMKKTNYYWEAGFGIDIYLRYFKFSPSIRGVFAIYDDIPDHNKDTNYIGKVDGAYTRAVFVNFTFE